MKSDEWPEDQNLIYNFNCYIMIKMPLLLFSEIHNNDYNDYEDHGHDHGPHDNGLVTNVNINEGDVHGLVSNTSVQCNTYLSNPPT